MNNSTSPKKGPFGEGGKVFGISPSIFDSQFGWFWPISANLWLFEIQKIWDFQYFWANLANFFFKMRFWAKLVLQTLKMDFLRLFRPMIYIHFRPFTILSFYAFFMLKSVVYSHNHLKWKPKKCFLTYKFAWKLSKIFWWAQDNLSEKLIFPRVLTYDENDEFEKTIHFPFL